MIIKLYRRISLAFTLFMPAKVAHADTVASVNEVSPRQPLAPPNVETHPYPTADGAIPPPAWTKRPTQPSAPSDLVGGQRSGEDLADLISQLQVLHYRRNDMLTTARP